MIYTDSTATVNNITTIETNRIYDINNGLLTSTATHNHVVKHNGSWYIKQTAKLVVGDILLNNNGDLIEIESITVINQTQTVYNLDVTNSNLYFANGVLTHNK
jgi:intein/homing endonuclease